MTLTAILLLVIVTALLAFMLGALVLQVYWAIRSRAAERSRLLGPLPQPAPVPVSTRRRPARG
jgi:hypothetical protein